MTDIQTITDEWAKWVAGRSTGNVGVKYTASTDYSGKFDSYKQYQVSTRVLDNYTRITGTRNVKTSTEYQDIKDIKNNSSVDQTDEFTFAYDVTNTHRFSVTRAVKIGVKVSGGVSIPYITDTKAEVSSELSLSDINERLVSEKATFSSKSTVKVPANRHIMARASLLLTNSISDWEVPIELDGYVGVTFDKWVIIKGGDGAHMTWFFPIAEVFGDVFYYGIADTTGYQIVGNKVHAIAQGECTSSYTAHMSKEFREGNMNDGWDDMPHGEIDNISSSSLNVEAEIAGRYPHAIGAKDE